ncbi:MAG: extracellular solute-binding protein [Candidatus Ozemobacteraceae bacterium]
MGPRPADEDPEGVTIYGFFRSGSSKSFLVDDFENLPKVSFSTADKMYSKKGGEARSFVGVLIQNLIKECQPTMANSMISLVGADGYRVTAQKEDWQKNRIYVCYKEEGELIGREKGPFRVVLVKAEPTVDSKKLDTFGVRNLRKIILGSQPSLNKRSIELWTPIPEGIMNQIKTDYERNFPEMNLNIQVKGANILHKWATEYIASPAQHAPDMIWFSDPSDPGRLKIAGRLESYYPKNAEKVASIYRDPDGYYTGIRILNIGLVCNTNYRIPEKLSDLLNDEYKGKIGWVQPRQIGTYLLAGVTSNEDLGWDFIRGVLQNTSPENVFKTFGNCCDQVAKGKLAVGITLDYLVRNLIRANPDIPIVFVQPSQMAISVASPIVIIKKATDMTDSETFVDYMLSDEVQLLLVKNGFTITKNDSSSSNSIKSTPSYISISSGSQQLPLFQSSPVLMDHRYISVNAPILQRCYRELESQVYGKK